MIEIDSLIGFLYDNFMDTFKYFNILTLKHNHHVRRLSTKI